MNRPQTMNAPADMCSIARVVIWLTLSWLTLCWSACRTTDAQEIETKDRLTDGPPFDTLYLKDPPQAFRVEPLPLSPRAPIASIAPDRVFVVQMLGRPDRKYRIRGESLERIVLFEQRVLEEISQYVAQRDFENAYQDLRVLEKFSPEFPGLKKMHESTLMTEAQQWAGELQWERAWVVALELCRRNAEFPGADSLLADVAQHLMAGELASGDDRAARARYVVFAERFPRHAGKDQLAALLRESAAEALASATAASLAEEWASAFASLRRAKRLWPELNGLSVLEAQLQKEHPVITVGVRQLTATVPLASSHWEFVRESPLMGGDKATSGSYQRQFIDGQVVWTFVQAEQGARGDAPYQVIEQLVPEDDRFMSLWQQGELAAVDRVWPWEIAAWKREFGAAVKPYRGTTVHWLVVNPRSKWLADPLLRRAVSGGVNRQRVVTELVGSDVDGSAVFGWPLATLFPKEVLKVRVPVPRYRPELMVELLQEAWQVEQEQTRGKRPALTLARPADPLSVRACELLQAQLELGGLGPKVTVRAVRGERPFGEWDLWYVPWHGFDASRDVVRVFGERGIIGRPPAAAVELLQRSQEMEIAARIEAIASESSEQMFVIPLWEFREFYLQQSELVGLQETPSRLFEDVREWRYESK